MKRITLIDLISVALMMVLLLPAVRPLFSSGFFTMHDDQQIVRLAQMNEALKAGQFPIRWVDDLGFGYGYPMFNFYPPLVYYLGQIYFLLFDISLINAMKLVFATSFIGAAIAMYYWVKTYFGKSAGVIAALFYTYAPYRAVDAYVRGALAEAFSFVWLPIVMLAMEKISQEAQSKAASVIQSTYFGIAIKRSQIKWVILLGVAYGLLMLTHNLIVLPFTLIMGLYFGLTLVRLPVKFWSSYIPALIVAGVLGLGLSAFFWLPALAEKQFTLVDQILLEQRFDHSLHYVEPQQLWNSLWGYAGSTAGPLDGFSLKIGKLHLALASGVGLVALVSLMKLKVPFIHKITQYRNQLLVLSTVFCLLVFSTWMTTEYSAVIWDTFTPIQFLQFPWRFLTFINLFTSFLVGASVWLVRTVFKNWILDFVYCILIIVLLFIPNLKLFQPQTYLDVTDAYYTESNYVRWIISGSSFEFVPREVETRIDLEEDITRLAIDQDQVATTAYEVLNGQVEVEVIADLPHKRILKADAQIPSQIQFNTYSFPGWKLFINDQEVPINDDNRLHLITTIIPAGESTIRAELFDTPVRKVGNWITLGTGIALGGFLFGQRKKLLIGN